MEKILLTSKTCKHCITAKEILKDTSDLLIKDIEENEELAIKYGVRAVPTLVTVCKIDGVKSYVGTDKIEEFVNKSKKTACQL
ncbi:MAG: hypothetical protein ACRC4T_17360 [Cetobacterium sp.]